MKLALGKVYVIANPSQSKWSTITAVEELFTNKAEAEAELKKLAGQWDDLSKHAGTNYKFTYRVMTLNEYLDERISDERTEAARDATADESF